jgi:DNA-binding transcriptional regulator YhcF (GntR family)
MKEQIIALTQMLQDKEVAENFAKAAKNMVDAFVEQGFSKSEAIELITHIQGK